MTSRISVRSRRWLIVLLAALVAVVMAGGSGLMIAPAAHASGAQNRVGAQHPTGGSRLQDTAPDADYGYDLDTTFTTTPANVASAAVRGKDAADSSVGTVNGHRRFSLAAEGAGTAAPDLANLSSKIEGDLVKRCWTPQEIQDAYDSGEQIPAVNKANGAAATRYVNPTTGKSVVIENGTGQVIHVGGEGFKYGPGSGDLP